MLIKVDKDNVKILDKPNLHKGEYGVNKCKFEFSEEYEGLVKIAVFKYDYSVYNVDIINNLCNIPSEVLEQAGNVILGVYAYVSENETLLLRYSPVADLFKVGSGSYTSGGKTPAQVTPTQYEMYSQELTKGLDEVYIVRDQLLEDKANGVFDGKDYIVTEEDLQEIEINVKSDIQPILENIENISKQAEVIARGRATGYVFETVEDLDLWLQDETNTSKLTLGDNFYIVATNVPDYWWDGTQKRVLETEKPDLTEYAKKEQFVSLTQAEYDALQTKSANTYYFIPEEE